MNHPTQQNQLRTRGRVSQTCGTSAAVFYGCLGDLIPSKAAIRAVAQFLYDPSFPKRVPKDVVPISNRVLAARTLGRMIGTPGQMINNPPTTKDPALYQMEDVEKWQRWWEANKSKYAD